VEVDDQKPTRLEHLIGQLEQLSQVGHASKVRHDLGRDEQTIGSC
jgi:hypothetical protein